MKVEKYTLPNGLEVLLLEDHTTPVVGVNLWYKVGSKNEKPGRTGFAHLFEHLMFQGSEHHDKDYSSARSRSSVPQINGSTSTDRTNYFETLPSNGLELALWLESDRMGFLLPALTQQKLDNQRDVVKNERRRSVDNVPYGQSLEKMLDGAVSAGPPLPPQRHRFDGRPLGRQPRRRLGVLPQCTTRPTTPVWRSSATSSRRRRRDWSICTSARYPRGPNLPKLTPSIAKLEGPKHITMTDKVTLARAQLAWPTVVRGHLDESALDVLAAVLGGLPKENRLYRTLGLRQATRRADRDIELSQRARGHFRRDDHRQTGPEARRVGQDRR